MGMGAGTHLFQNNQNTWSNSSTVTKVFNHKQYNDQACSKVLDNEL